MAQTSPFTKSSMLEIVRQAKKLDTFKERVSIASDGNFKLQLVKDIDTYNKTHDNLLFSLVTPEGLSTQLLRNRNRELTQDALVDMFLEHANTQYINILQNRKKQSAIIDSESNPNIVPISFNSFMEVIIVFMKRNRVQASQNETGIYKYTFTTTNRYLQKSFYLSDIKKEWKVNTRPDSIQSLTLGDGMTTEEAIQRQAEDNKEYLELIELLKSKQLKN